MKRKNLEIGIFKALFHNVPHKGLNVLVITVSVPIISPLSVRFIISLTVILSEKSDKLIFKIFCYWL